MINKSNETYDITFIIIIIIIFILICTVEINVRKNHEQLNNL